MRHATNFFPTVMVAIEHIVVLLPIFCDGSNDINLKATTIVRLILLGSDRVTFLLQNHFVLTIQKQEGGRESDIKVLQFQLALLIVLSDNSIGSIVRVSKLPFFSVRLSFVFVHTC